MKCPDQGSKARYLQISEAYTKLNSVMEGTDGYKGDESHEVAAFMRMFMDMVGISESDSIPAGELIICGLSEQPVCFVVLCAAIYV